MKSLKTLVLAVCLAVALPTASHAIDLWHSNTLWYNGGMCGFSFTLDGQDIVFDVSAGGGLSGLILEIVLLDENLDELGPPQEIRLAEPFADSDATRYAQFVVEGDCSAEVFGIGKATGIIGGKTLDLLEARQITPTTFESKSIVLPAKYGE